MIYKVSLSENINYDPKNEIEDILRNVNMILRVTKGEQPLMRDFSLDSNLIDKNIDIIKNKLVSILIENLKKYEPRAILKNLNLSLLNNNNNDYEIELDIKVVLE